MAKPKLSVILPNYGVPADRFSTYGSDTKDIFGMIDICGKQGVAKGVELLMGDAPVCINKNNMKDVKAALKKYGISPIAVLPITWGQDFIKGSLGNADPKKRRKAIDLVKSAMDLAAEIGSPYVGQWPGQDGWDYYFEVDYQKLYDWWVAGLQELADYNPKIKLGVEPKPFEPRSFSFIDTPIKTLMLIRDVNRKNVGLTLDIGHSLFGHENLGSVVALAQKENKLFHLHMNDNYGEMDWDMPFGSVHFLGTIEFIYWLVRTKYDGWHSVDIFPYRTDPAETVLESLKWMQAMYDLVEKIGMNKLDALIEKSDGVTMMRFFRELLLEK
ncbi:MAG: sugar phosphate isomerase/epimerase [Anaerolineaceae bacterium]|jgi:xylose isomerase|nr:sugar phosphate isomerase/epimerase [Anaerolineaceae bacterium]